MESIQGIFIAEQVGVGFGLQKTEKQPVLHLWKRSVALPSEDAWDECTQSWEGVSRQQGLPNLLRPQLVKHCEGSTFLPLLTLLFPHTLKNVFTHMVTSGLLLVFSLGFSLHFPGDEDVQSMTIYLKAGRWLWNKAPG